MPRRHCRLCHVPALDTHTGVGWWGGIGWGNTSLPAIYCHDITVCCVMFRPWKHEPGPWRSAKICVFFSQANQYKRSKNNSFEWGLVELDLPVAEATIATASGKWCHKPLTIWNVTGQKNATSVTMASQNNRFVGLSVAILLWIAKFHVFLENESKNKSTGKKHWDKNIKKQIDQTTK